MMWKLFYERSLVLKNLKLIKIIIIIKNFYFYLILNQNYKL